MMRIYFSVFLHKGMNKKNLPFKLALHLNLSAFSIVANFFKWYGKITKVWLLLFSRIWRIIFFWILFIFEVSSMYIVFFLKIFINFVHNNSKTFISKCPKYAFFCKYKMHLDKTTSKCLTIYKMVTKTYHQKLEVP